MTSQTLVPADVVVVIPAHNEAPTLHDCLRSVLVAIQHAKRHRLVASISVVVVAHRCTDATIDLAREVVGPRIPGLVAVLDELADVGRVRDLGARIGLCLQAQTRPDSTWILSTDADTVVPHDWVTASLAEAATADAACVVGLAELDSWRGSEPAARAYDELVAAKTGRTSHGHVYGANLAIRADAYLAVGGFPAAGHGEDQRLVDALARSGYVVHRSLSIKVTTSGRMVGRARGGLASLLRQLDAAAEDGISVDTSTQLI